MNDAQKARNYDKEEREKRNRLAQVRVLLADRDLRTAKLVYKILFSFGFRAIEMVNSGDEALDRLKSMPFDLIITEWNMTPVDGVMLVKGIRAARDDNRIRRDIPIIMLTAHAEQHNVEAARDAGINEFLVKPFSAKTMSQRIIQLIDMPRPFIEVNGYSGPCRRRKVELPEGMQDRRVRAPRETLPPNMELRNQLGIGAELLNEAAIGNAQMELLKAESEFVEWARDDIAQLETAYARLVASPQDAAVYNDMREVAYSIKSQAGIFGYELGTAIGGLLARYLSAHDRIEGDQLLVVRKHIDAIVVIFTQKIKDAGQDIAQDLVTALRKLTVKIG